MKESPLLTDLYQLTMMAGYFEDRIDYTATFELFVRKYPEHRCYLIAAGLEQIIDYVQNLTFSEDEIDWIRNNKIFKHVSDEFFEYLKEFRFTGEMWAMPEGTVFLQGEPVIRVTAPIIQAQLLETYLLSLFNFQSMIATKASLMVYSAKGGRIIEFGSRRAHGPEAGLLAARASYIGGCVGTSNVYAGFKFGIPTFGTQAHSWIMAHDSEKEAFENYYKIFPESTIFLVDTYDTIDGVKHAIEVSKSLQGVRLDSGDLHDLSVKTRKFLDMHGLNDAIIVVSGDLTEFKLKRLINQNSPIDVFGVGTELVTSADSPSLNGIYKLVEVEKDGRIIPKAKFSEKKSTYPGKKQVWRFLGSDGKLLKDVISTLDESFEDAFPLLELVVKDGKMVAKQPSLKEIREKCLKNLQYLNKTNLGPECNYCPTVLISDGLQAKFNEVFKKYHG